MYMCSSICMHTHVLHLYIHAYVPPAMCTTPRPARGRICCARQGRDLRPQANTGIHSDPRATAMLVIRGQGHIQFPGVQLALAFASRLALAFASRIARLEDGSNRWSRIVAEIPIVKSTGNPENDGDLHIGRVVVVNGSMCCGERLTCDGTNRNFCFAHHFTSL